MIWNAATSTLARLWPGESIHVLEKAFEDELVEPFFIGMEDVEHYLEEGKEPRLAAFERGALRELARTPHEEMSWWACFNPSQNQGYSFDDGSHTQNRKRSAAKKKRKQARAARKKGRPRKKKEALSWDPRALSASHHTFYASLPKGHSKNRTNPAQCSAQIQPAKTST